MRRIRNQIRVWALAGVLCIGMAGATAGTAAAQGAPASIGITSPADEETIHDNTGRVPVAVALDSNALPTGGAIRVLLDGAPLGPARTTASFALEGVERGEHTLQVQLLDAAGNVAASSPTVKFYMWQASKLLPSRKK